MKIKKVKMIEMKDWDNLVKKTYKKPYAFQQQNGCIDRGLFHLIVSSTYIEDIEMNDEIPEIINGDIRGVKFIKWLERDPKQHVGKETLQWVIDIFWERNFYPDIHVLAHDLFKKGLLEEGELIINIDW